MCTTRLQSTHLLLTKLLITLCVLLLFLDQRQCTPETQLIALAASILASLPLKAGEE